MDIQSYFNQMKMIQSIILNYIESYHNAEENYQNIIQFFNDQKIKTNKYLLKSILHLLLKISNNHYRLPYFFIKIENIIQYLLENIKQTWSNFEIFHIFKSNKRILLFLIEEKIIDIDSKIYKIINNGKYAQANYTEYFFPEIKHYLNEEQNEALFEKYHEKFEEKRKTGENDNYICELIRNDLIDNFISYVNQNDINIHDDIEISIFETNQFLIQNKPNLIQYAAFYGSIQIFKYLYKNGANLTPILWIYAIHSQNPEIISILEEINVELSNKTLKKMIHESIKCHHIEMINFFQNKLLENNENEIENSQDEYLYYLHYYNFNFQQILKIYDLNIFDLVQYDYFIPVQILLKTNKVDINQKICVILNNFKQFKNPIF